MDLPHIRLRATVTDELRQIYEKGLAHAAETRAAPALAELGDALATRTESATDEATSGDVIEAVLHRAIAKTPKELRAGLTVLLGLGAFSADGIGIRRDESAPMLGFRSGDSLRQDRRGGRKTIDIFLDLVTEQLVALAVEAQFHYSKLMTYSSFYPDRPVYDYNRRSREYDRYGAQDGRPVFNSFINTPSYGDERAFFDGRRGDQPVGSDYDPVHDVTSGDGTVILRIHVDNMAAFDEAAPDRATARGTRVRVLLPSATSEVLRSRAYITAANADTVEDTVDLIGSDPFRVEYVPGSAVLRRHRFVYPLDDAIVEKGALIGHVVMDGNLPASHQFEFTALVNLTVRVSTR